MVTLAPNWTIDAGWQYINTTNVSLVEAGVDGLKRSAGYVPGEWFGYAYYLGILLVFMIVGFMLWQRSQKVYVAVFGMIITSVLLGYFGILEQEFMNWLMIIGAVAIGIEWISWFQKKD